MSDLNKVLTALFIINMSQFAIGFIFMAVFNSKMTRIINLLKKEQEQEKK